MNASVSFTVPGKPQGKQRPRLGKGGRVYTPSATKRYEHMVAWAALGARPREWSKQGRFVVEVTMYFADLRRRDVDKERVTLRNVLKAVLDGMQGVLYEDDSQVVIASAIKWLDRETPRTVVVVKRGAAG
jgi:Holliday junction resolvase RusA-like endonuclease